MANELNELKRMEQGGALDSRSVFIRFNSFDSLALFRCFFFVPFVYFVDRS
jgi:hypothetical protein